MQRAVDFLFLLSCAWSRGAAPTPPAQGSTPSVSLLEAPAGGSLSLLCVSEGWYPPPELLWTDETGADWRAHFTTNEEQDSTGLVTVRSQIHLPRQQGHAPRQQNTMMCVVRSKDGATELKTVMNIAEDCDISMQRPVIASSILAAVICIAVLWYFTRKLTKDNSKEGLENKIKMLEEDFKDLRKNTNACGYALGREWKKMTEARVNVTLDPDTASPSLRVSEDSQVRFTGERSAEWPSVLGREGFTSGKHYWEVEVGEKGYWVLGVSTHTHEKSIPEKPGEGYWLVRLVRGKTCTAVSQSGDQILKLEKICKVWGVYLDHEGGRLSFCNAETRFHIHTLEGPFTGQVYPIFSPGSHDKGPLIIQCVQHTAANFI
ncbi:erythroid membrane-associated protein-like [Acipenser ruthenus]|uniref:erythroid membrane-associated protein-like n=1 Tax=Acipenser ruthenus TaxID=7906 RepID=UPI00274202DD|nr:erythroid membrane-associated protein-like [Acipenser ruthenus]XP_058868310.1 erythroid membrane-associated protein-like [Acipenser ruthenus]XP_058868311.1 erythroid membrane-associated protein-like [Acipenser ruthenus]